jgi:hypothetical protein
LMASPTTNYAKHRHACMNPSQLLVKKGRQLIAEVPFCARQLRLIRLYYKNSFSVTLPASAGRGQHTGNGTHLLRAFLNTKKKGSKRKIFL